MKPAVALRLFLAAMPLVAIFTINSFQEVAFASPMLDNANVDPPVTSADLKVVARARSLLKSPAVWNRKDTRECAAHQRTYSIYCAIEIASFQVEGRFAHRSAVMQQARFAVDELTAKRNYRHRLKDFNNDPKTSFHDIVRLFDLMQARMRAKLDASASSSNRPSPQR